MQRYLGPRGLLAENVPGFEFRPSQLQMANTVFECLQDQTALLAEAGTGTGKTWGYLIPALLSGKRVVVSTGTKTLQDQILDHDIPLLKKLVFPRLRAVCLKGRKNYLCRRRFHDFAYQPSFWNREEAKLFRDLQQWATRTISGDRAEIDWLPDEFHTWNEVSSNSDQCLGLKCPEHGRCFLTVLRQEASRAHLLVVNHHLFFADLAVRHRGQAEVIPDYDAVIFDEAHQLEDTIGLYFGVEISNLKINELARDLSREFTRESTDKKSWNRQAVQDIARQVEALSRQFHQELSRRDASRGRFLLDLPAIGDDFAGTCRQMIHAFEQLAALLTPARESHTVADSVCRRSLELAHSLESVLEQRDPDLVYWYECTAHAVFIHGTPIEVAPILQQRLFPRTRTVILTSATLSVAGSFDFIRSCLGMPDDTRELLAPSPFVYDRQGLLYIPSQVPPPQARDFCNRVAQEALKILLKTRGRALFLFTSYRNLNLVHQQLLEHLPFPILAQGQRPKRALLAEFKQKIDSVLLATSSFWQGIDVPGEALTCLLIDKLPFEVPDDPIIAARMEQLSRQGKNPFYQYQVPRAIIQLKQGVGRLIRSSHDRGIVVIFDVRLRTKGYGNLFIQSLPPFRIVHRFDEIDAFLSAQDAHHGMNPLEGGLR